MPHKTASKPAYRSLRQRVLTDVDKCAAAASALTSLTGLLGIQSARIAPLRTGLEKAVVTGDVSGIYWDDNDDSEDDDTGYTRFGSVAVVDVSGVLLPESTWWMRYLGCRSTPEIAEGIRAAADDANIKTIVLKIESPGGQVQGIAELADTVRAIGQQKRIIAYTSGLCCSCAYWVASQTARIYSSRLADVGCIGTLYVVSDWSKYHKELGVTVDAITSTGAEMYKGAGAFGTVITPEQKADFKRVCDECQVHFTQAVATGRFGGNVEKAQALATGQVHVGPAALALGLVDEIVPDTFDAWLSRLSGADGVDYDPDTDISPLSDDDDTDPITTPTQTTAVQTSGKEIKVMPFTLEELRTGIAQLFGVTPVASTTTAQPTEPSDTDKELARLREDNAKRLAARKETVTKVATTAFKGQPERLAAAVAAIENAPDETVLTSLEGAYQAATPTALTNSNRASHGQAIDEPVEQETMASAKGINTTEIYASRKQAMRGGR